MPFLYLTLIIICSNGLQQKAEQTIIIMLRSQIQPRVADTALSVSKRRSRFSGVLHSLRWLYCMGVWYSAPNFPAFVLKRLTIEDFGRRYRVGRF